MTSLRRSIDSLRATSHGAELETLIALDDDDLTSIQELEEDPIAGSLVLIGPRQGYIRLHNYVNALCQHSTGDWLFLWNDDALMQTGGWDEVISRFEGQLVVLNPETNHGNHNLANCIFPIVPRKMIELLGHFSLSNHNDTYVEHIANSLGIRRDIPIFVLHDRADFTGSNNDEVFHERQFTTDEFFGPENMGNVHRDIEILRQHLASEGAE